jgi:O-antigen/teichoic acid export membrane protein
MFKKIFTNESFLNYLKSTSWLLTEKILRLSIGLYVSIWVTRYLGPENFGIYAYSVTFVGLLSFIASLGLDGILVKWLVKDEDKSNEILGTSLILKLLGAALSIIIILIAVNQTSSNDLTKYLVLIISLSTLFQTFNVVELYFQSKVMGKYIAYSNIISLLICNILKVILIYKNASLEFFAYVFLFEAFLISLCFVIYFLYLSPIRLRDLKFKRELAFNLLKDSWPMILSGLVISLYMKIDQIMIKEILGAEFVGYYAAAVRLSEAWYFVPLIVATSIFPAIIRSKENNNNVYKQRIGQLNDFMFYIGLSIALPMTFLSNFLVKILYGEEFIPSGDILMIHIWAGIFVCIGISSSKWLVAEGLQVFYTVNTAIGAILNIILNYVLINKYGIAGAAWATLITQFCASYLALSFWKKTRPNFFSISQSFLFMRLLNVKRSS